MFILFLKTFPCLNHFHQIALIRSPNSCSTYEKGRAEPIIGQIIGSKFWGVGVNFEQTMFDANFEKELKTHTKNFDNNVLVTSTF